MGNYHFITIKILVNYDNIIAMIEYPM